MDRKAVSQRIRGELSYYRHIATDSRTPWVSKALIGLAIAYLLSPIDIIPDFIPVLGHLDDIIVVPGLLWLAMVIIPRVVKEDARKSASTSVTSASTEDE